MIDAYGNSGFRFRDMSHKGSLLILPSGMYSWPPADASALRSADFDAVWQEASDIGFLLLGTGDVQTWPDREIERTDSPCLASCIPALNDPELTDESRVLGTYDETYRKVDGTWLVERCVLQFLWPNKQVTEDFTQPFGPT